MVRTIQSIFLIGVLTLFTTPAPADDFYIFPNKGQSQEQMEKDKYECYAWAKGQSGFDPMQTPRTTTPPPKQGAKQGGLLRGGAKGAAVGAAVGSLSGDMGEGAKYGAVAGGLIGGMRRREQVRHQKQAEQQWAQEQANAYAQKRNGYNRAYTACLEGKDYTVK